MTNSFVLHILAIITMTCDHVWSVIKGYEFLTWIGRLAFPIFAFMIVEGYFHTSDLKKYRKRLLILALISEIPFNMMVGGSFIYPFQQNVIWTFLIGLICMEKVDKLRESDKLIVKYLKIAGVILLGALISLLSMADYLHYGFLTMMVFYFFRGKSWFNLLWQFIGMYIINCVMYTGEYKTLEIGKMSFDIYKQSMAMFSLIPIWLYNGKKGPYNKYIKFIYYAYYPVHMFILGISYMFRV